MNLERSVSTRMRATLALVAALQVWSGDGLAAPPAASPIGEDYNQWKEALQASVATAAAQLQGPPGFSVSLVRSARPDEGSWVSMAFDPRGRVVLAREDAGLLRLTLPDASGVGGLMESINTNLLEVRGLLFAHGALYANANNSKGLYRLRDSKGNDRFDEVQLLRATPGGVGHGRNQLALGPDGMIYSAHGDDVQLPPAGAATHSPLAHYQEDRLLPCAWDRQNWNAYVKVPAGHLIRTDPDGGQWELVAGGLRNPFGIAFNSDGELFTYDADMEFDIGLPWYHPTRVLHLVSGADYGWRRGTGVLPVWFPDTSPSALDIGKGSPTAILFGTRSHFPRPWRDALFLLDWAYGKIYAIQLTPVGASYRGQPEIFLAGRPLNVTSLDFGPDGALYFVTGGRRTQSGLYRVAWTGVRSAPTVASGNGGDDVTASARAARALRRQLEKFHGRIDADALRVAWPELEAEDPWIRQAARVAVESQPVALWQEKALTEDRPTAALVALLALVRTAESALALRVWHQLDQISSQVWSDTSTRGEERRLLHLRALSLSFIRFGSPAREFRESFQASLDRVFPTAEPRVNQGLHELLVYLEAPDIVAKTLDLLPRARSQEEKFQYLFNLRLVPQGWTLERRRAYFSEIAKARREFAGASAMTTAFNNIVADAESTLPADMRAALADALSDARAAQGLVGLAPAKARAFVRDWTLPELVGALPAVGHGRSFVRGHALFLEAGCAQCHRMGFEGGTVGPDLTSVGSRFDRRALLESILEPSKVVAESYRNLALQLRAGDTVEGRLVGEDDREVVVSLNPLDPTQRRRIVKDDIVGRRVSEISPMPSGLVNTLNREEILDLLAWVEAGGARTHANYRP